MNDVSEESRREYETIARYLNRHLVKPDGDRDLRKGYDNSGLYLTLAGGQWRVMEGGNDE
jgi:hypothetical protein